MSSRYCSTVTRLYGSISPQFAFHSSWNNGSVSGGENVSGGTYVDELLELDRVLVVQMAEADEFVREELEVVVGDDAVFVHVQEAVDGAHFLPPEFRLALLGKKWV